MQPGGEATDDAAPDVAGIRASWLRRTRPALPRLAEYVTVFFAAAVAVALLVIRTDLKTMGTAAFADPGWDRHLYIEMARRGPFDFHLAPYCWRILEPALAAALPFDLQASFMTVTLAALVGLGAAVYGLVRTAGFSPWHGLIAMLLFFSLGWGPKFVVSDFWVPDALGTLFIVLALIFGERPIRRASFLHPPRAVALRLAAAPDCADCGRPGCGSPRRAPAPHPRSEWRRQLHRHHAAGDLAIPRDLPAL